MADPVTAAADKVSGAASSVKDAVKSHMNLKTLFTLGAVGTVITASGLLLGPFLAASTGQVVLNAAAATNGAALGAFHSTLFTNATGQLSASGALAKMGHGIVGLAKSSGAVIGATAKTAWATQSPAAAWASFKATLAAPLGTMAPVPA